MRIIFTLCVLLLLASPVHAQNRNYIVSGVVSEAGSEEVLIGAYVVIYKDSVRKGNPLRSITSNKFGFYSLPALPGGKYYIFSGALGYETFKKEVELSGEKPNIRLDIKLLKTEILLSEVKVFAEKYEDFANTSGTVELDPELIQTLPSFGGETDIFRALQLLPGVSNANELSAGIYVRGSSADQTLTLIDGVQVYNPSHLGGFASTFNSDAIQNIKLIKGAFPAQYGGRLSSVLDVTTREGSSEKFIGTANLSNISSRFTIEGPLSDKSTYILSARVMYLDKLLSLIPQAERFPRYGFYDANGKIHYKLSETDRLFITGFFSSDQLTEPPASKDIGFDIGWKNSTLNLTWTKIYTSQIFTSTSLVYTYYDFKTAMKDKNPQKKDALDFFTSSLVNDFQLKTDIQIFLNEANLLQLGAEATYHNFEVLTSDFYTSELKYAIDLGRKYKAIEVALFAQDEITWFQDLKTNLGVRFYYFNEGKLYGWEPRASLTWYMFDRLIFRAAFAMANQPIHLMARNDVYLPTDVWFPSTPVVKPAKSMQGAIGFEGTSADKTFLFTVEAYYKDLANLYEYREDANFAYTSKYEDQLTVGRGEAYGVEMFFNKRIGTVTGWFGYTLSWTKRYFDDLNRSVPFYPQFDRRHDVSIVLSWQASEALSFAATWNYSTGKAFPLPVMQYSFLTMSNPNDNTQEVFYEYSARDAFRLPAFHKLDLSVNWVFDWGDNKAELSLNIYNVYNRYNVFSKYVGYKIDEVTGIRTPVLKQFTLYPFLPSLGLKVHF
ncbi:MAG: TonB-dependent receptor [Chlorobiota bacterium]|nr:MAG: TonB-dependent receptor [Chlorobiota bacterium]